MNELLNTLYVANFGQMFFTAMFFGTSALIVAACIIRDYIVYGNK